MKKIAMALATVLLASTPVVSVTGAETNPQTDGKAAAQDAPRAPNTEEFDKQLEKIQQQMNAMHEQMQKIQNTQDPKERQKLLDEHWISMRSTMDTMHGLWDHGMGPAGMGHGGMGMGMGPGMMGRGGGGWMHMRGYYSHLTPEQMRQHQYMMDQYMNMQQQMMNHMMWQQQYRNGGPPKTP
ncbi:hypothetical protein [Pseudomonas schmalbachii]|uniref:Uncharacterized protein n=1 Tax=Pseudomonas schmalbachii TaxID=2816993 RepID=A0ABS3TJC3_9PSED|nr:hypothetical protein [Pseudomonas schmalbachii]MBO3273745.1 hypothetical protein [Pseudomonas schmalbachii]